MKKVLLTLTMLLFAFTGVMRASAEQGNVRADQVIEQGFEDGLGDWTMNHCHSSSGPTSSYGGNTGNYAFRFYYTTNYPQYLISPELDDNDGVNLTFYAARYSSSYPETFKVGYSSTTNDPTEFTWGSEVTCTTMYGAGAYQEYSYDFPAGTKYVSIACTSNDQFYLFVDDITVTATEPAPTPGGIVEVTIGDPTSTTTNQYLPGYTLYDYAISQQIYTADEIGVAGTINTLTVWLKNSSSYARNINVYMKEVEATVFASNTAWESFTASDMVASFTMPNGNSTPIEVALPLDNPFVYSGTNNLAICFQDVTGQWSSGLGGVVMDASGNQAIYAYRDGTVYDPSNPGVNGTLLAKKNVIRLSIATGGAPSVPQITYAPDPIDLGMRPIGAWMAPFVVELGYNMPEEIEVIALSTNNNFYTVNADVPFTISKTQSANIEISTGEAEEGPQDAEMVVLYNDSRSFVTIPITAYAYTPVDGDVFETAVEVTSFPYTQNAPANIYGNYEIPGGVEDANDAVYELTFADDVLLTANTTGTDGAAALYTEDFYGQPGPMVDNYYSYEGPEINPGPLSLWFSYNYTGTNTWYGTSAGGGFYFGYQIPVSYIEGLGLAGTTITNVEAAAREAYPYECYILEGGANPGEASLIGYGVIENTTAMYFFDINLEVPAYISGNNNIWVIFYSDSPYAAYCGKVPTDVNNAKIWTYNPNATTPSWSSNTTYTPVIYSRFLELPTGREVTVNLADMTIRESKGAEGQLAEADGQVMNIARSQYRKNQTRVVEENLIDAMYVPAGTYYLVMASSTDEFPVSISTEPVPAPEQAIVLSPYDGETNVEAPYLAEWILGDYTTEMQVLVGTQYPPQTALIDWTDYLVESAFITDLEPNQSYFMQVNERNATGTTMGEIIAFTTPIDPVEGFAVENDELYPGDAANFSWAANNRTLQGYNIYKDGVKVNESVITENAYSVEGLEYNMDGYDFQVSAVYDAGESELSEPITVYMTGNGSVNGHVYDIDVEHPIAGATVVALGEDEYENVQSFEFTTDETGFYEGELLAGEYIIAIATEGYEAEGVFAAITYDQLTEADDIITHEFYYPVGQVTATDEGDDVLVEWSWDPAEYIVDFESGDFSQAEFTLPAQYPWTVTTTNPYEGTYCMKSTCEGQASTTSEIEVTVEVPFEEAKMGFYVRTSSEANYDKFHFYIDGVEQGQALSGQNPYAYKEYSVAGGTHTYKWAYTKDSSVNSNDDCIYVDYITLYRKDEPLPPIPGATVYDFDNGAQGWTSLDANNDGYGWVLGSEIGGVYLVSGASLSGSGHNESTDLMCSGSYSNATSSAITPDNYLVAPTAISAQAGAAISFWACAQDASYAAEHFGVAVSTTTATASAFTMVQEWTMTAKGPQGSTAENAQDIRGTRAQGSWYQYQVDLSSYAGQDIWVAIRHFNCNDQFILNVDDITLADGSAKALARDLRSFQSFNIYRRNNIDPESVAVPELLAEGVNAETFEYVDAEWPELSYGEWQWGVAATYDGYAPTERNRETATFGFENDLEGWTGIVVNSAGGEWIHSDDNLGGYDYTELAHTGEGFAMCYSYVDYVGAYNTDAYLVSPQKYSVDANSTITFWADNANDTYPENFSVCVSTADTPTASSFTQVWSGGAKGAASGEKAAVRHQDNRYQNWRSHEISLAAYAGQEIWIAFHDVNYDAYEIWIDDVTINYAGSAPVPPTPGPVGSGISEIIWSNVIEKDMEATVLFDVTLSNGQSPMGAAIEITNEEHTYTAEVDELGLAELVVRKGEYDITVALEGYTTFNLTDMIDDDEEVYEVTLVEIIADVDGLYVSPTGWVMWEGIGGGVTPTPTPGPGGVLLEDDFEDGALSNWTTIDADGDGDTWQNATPASYDIGNAHSGTNCASSWSWNNYSMDPDNWMISPMVEGATTLQYYVATNTGYPDHYGVYASSTGTATSDFTLVFQETAGSKGVAGVKSSMTQAGTRAMSDWAEKNIDLPAGTKYVAFRHWDSYDMNYLFIDDVTISAGSKGNRAPVAYKVMLDGIYEGETTEPYFQHNVDDLEVGSTHTTSVAALYVGGMSPWVTYEWTLQDCADYAGVTEFTAEQEGTDVVLNWTLPGVTPGPTPGGGSFTEDFENGLNGWTVLTVNSAGGQWLHSANNPGGYDYTTLAHGGSGFAMCYSYVDYVGAYNTDSYLITPQKYSIGANSVLTFWADNANDSYPENFSVCVATADNPTAADFTQVWSGGAKGAQGGEKAAVRHQDNRYNNWRSHSINLGAYAGQNVYIAFHDVNYDAYEIWIDDVELSSGTKGNRAMWDLEFSFNGTSGYQYGVATDGTNIYTSSWSASSTSMFYKYDLQGNFIEEFNISGCGQIRDLTYDGQYFYGVANSSTIYCVDLANHALVSTTNSAYGAMRCITYDPERDGFWVVGNWSGNLTLVSRTGAIVQSAAAPTSASGVAYYKDTNNIEHVLYLKNESGNGEVYEYNITTNTMGTTPIYNCVNTTGGAAAWTGSSGGCHVAAYNGKTCLFADAQQSPQLINIYELDAAAPGPGPGPQPVEGLVGAVLYRNGEIVGLFDTETTSFVDEGAESGENQYCIRVVYGGEPDVTLYAMSCLDDCEIVDYECMPVTDLSGAYFGGDDPYVTLTWANEYDDEVVYYEVYYNDTLAGTTTELTYDVHFDVREDLEFGVVAVYMNCESEMVPCIVTVTDVEEFNGNVNIYPNPTHSNVTVEAAGMNHITVVNSLGQVVYDADIEADMTQLNLGQFKAGVYMVRINTENGVVVKRVNVVK